MSAISVNNTIFATLIAYIWQCCKIVKQRSDWAGNTNSGTVRQVVNKPLG